MGTVAEYVLPGTFFLVFGIWWTIQILRRYYRSKLDRGREYKSTVTYPSSCLCSNTKKWQVEGAFKFLFAVIGGLTSIVAAFKTMEPVWHLNPGILKYFIISVCFGFSGIIDIVVAIHRNLLPKNTDYVFLAMAFFVEGFLHYSHLYGETAVFDQIHLFIVYICFGTTLCLIAEMRQPTNVLFALGRAFLTILQGTWCFQVGVILHNPLPLFISSWDMKDRTQILGVTEILASHILVIFLAMLICGVVVRKVTARGRGSGSEDGAMTELMTHGTEPDDSHLYDISSDDL